MRLHLLTRDLHLCIALFLSPFVLLFAVSVFFLTHAWVPGLAAAATQTRSLANLPLPPDLDSLAGRPRVDALHHVLRAAGVNGEVRAVRYVPKQHRLEVQLVMPGRETAAALDLPSRTARIQTRTTGVWDGLITLHKLPGPHLAATRLNWIFIRFWGWFADAAAVGVLLLSVTGLYLWYALRPERLAGAVLLAAGACSFLGIVYALSR